MLARKGDHLDRRTKKYPKNGRGEADRQAAVQLDLTPQRPKSGSARKVPQSLAGPLQIIL